MPATLVVEDGTAKANSNSYETSANAQTYYNDQGYSETATDGAMIRGSRALDALYRARFKGSKTTSGQAMAWPRLGVTDEDGNSVASDTIPAAVKHAAAELARHVPADQATDAGKSIESVKAGSVQVDFAGGYRSRTILDYVDELMAPYLMSRSRLVRA